LVARPACNSVHKPSTWKALPRRTTKNRSSSASSHASAPFKGPQTFPGPRILQEGLRRADLSRSSAYLLDRKTSQDTSWRGPVIPSKVGPSGRVSVTSRHCFLADSTDVKGTASKATPIVAPDVRGVVLGVDELAQVLHKSPATIKRDIHRKPQSLPPRLKIPGSSALLWLGEDVLRWLRGYSTTRRRGRPRKSETRRPATQQGGN